MDSSHCDKSKLQLKGSIRTKLHFVLYVLKPLSHHCKKTFMNLEHILYILDDILIYILIDSVIH